MEENTAPSPSLVQTPIQTPTVQKKTVLLIGGIVIAIAYIALNIGIWMYARNSGKGAQTDLSVQSQPITPVPRPTGPGQYACSPIGTCKDYSDEVRKESCTVTYADRLCLDQCADATKQCKY